MVARREVRGRRVVESFILKIGFLGGEDPNQFLLGNV